MAVGGVEYTVENLSGSLVFLQITGAFGKIGASTFAAITGYFMAERRFDVCGEGLFRQHYRKILPIVLQMYFYSVLAFAFVVIYGLITNHSIPQLSGSDLLRTALPFVWGNWYARYYLVLLVFIPFINLLTSSLDNKGYTRFAIALVSVWSIIPTASPDAWNYGYADIMIVMYLLGGFVRRSLVGRVSRKQASIWFALSLMALIGSILILDIAGKASGFDVLVRNAGYFAGFDKITAISIALSAVMYFSYLDFSNRFVNVIAESTFGIYLLHDNGVLRGILWNEIWPNIEHVSAPYLHLPVKCLCVFVLGLLIDRVRICCFARQIEPKAEMEIEKLIQGIGKCFKQK